MRQKTSWNSRGCCCRSFNRGLIWGRGPGVAACTSTSHYVGVRTWEVGPLANNGGMTLLVCFPFQMWNMAKQEGEDESESWAWSHTVFEAARHRFVGLTTCTTTPSQLHFLSEWNCHCDIEPVCSFLLLLLFFFATFTAATQPCPISCLFLRQYSN